MVSGLWNQYFYNNSYCTVLCNECHLLNIKLVNVFTVLKMNLFVTCKKNYPKLVSKWLARYIVMTYLKKKKKLHNSISVE